MAWAEWLTKRWASELLMPHKKQQPSRGWCVTAVPGGQPLQHGCPLCPACWTFTKAAPTFTHTHALSHAPSTAAVAGDGVGEASALPSCQEPAVPFSCLSALCPLWAVIPHPNNLLA